MNRWRFDWRWVAAIVVVAVLANSSRVPWQLIAATFAAAGGYLLYYGWGVWGGRSYRSSSHVKYWRGQRYEVRSQQRRPSLPSLDEIGPAAMYLAFGLILLLSALAVVLRRLG